MRGGGSSLSIRSSGGAVVDGGEPPGEGGSGNGVSGNGMFITRPVMVDDEM